MRYNTWSKTDLISTTFIFTQFSAVLFFFFSQGTLRTPSPKHHKSALATVLHHGNECCWRRSWRADTESAEALKKNEKKKKNPQWIFTSVWPHCYAKSSEPHFSAAT